MRRQHGGRLGRGSRWMAVFGALAAALLTMTGAAAVECKGPAVTIPALCGKTLEGPEISCKIPEDAQPETSTFYFFQRATNVFSWQAFIGLQWPASRSERGQPDPAARLGAPGPTVWESWREGNEVFRADGKPPLEWNAASPIPAQCKGADRVLFRASKVDDLLSDTSQPTGATMTRPLTLKDRNTQTTRYEIRINRTAYDAIVAGAWWSGARQANLDRVDFPDGSMIAKAAWIPVAARDAERFHAIDACVCDGAGGDTDCAVRKMGLVGFHLMSKTKSAPQWFWSTFEQKDNAPDACPGPTSARTPPFTYWSVAQGQKDVNQQTANGVANQICRTRPISDADPACADKQDPTDNVRALNTAVQGALSGTPFAHYELINTQWTAFGSSPPHGPRTQFAALPQLLGNTTLESFIQDTSSCMGCHAMARTRRNVGAHDPDGKAFYSSDFTFTLGTAQPAPAPPPRLSALTGCPKGPDFTGESPECAGLRIATQTYETLPGHVGAKLHCTSCHLDAGRNPRASWWRNVVEKWSKKEGGIVGRINSCFTNSMNGKALHPDDHAMKALIAYMSWLAQPENNPEKIPEYLPNAFPPVAAGQGVIARGAGIFLQKCAFCHGAGGEGRYEDNTYFRPALWGENSFNSAAGMASRSDLAPFVYGNMPFHSGGELTQQEARDLACFIDEQPRPKGPDKPQHLIPLTDISCSQLAEGREDRSYPR